MNYVIGFAFNGPRVALIRKNKPAWQKGRLNGIGGKIEPGEEPYAAMIREFREETGVETSVPEWQLKFHMKGERGDWSAFVFSMDMDDERFSRIASPTEELVEIHLTDYINDENCISNLYWMIPMVLDKSGVMLPITIPFRHADGTGS